MNRKEIKKRARCVVKKHYFRNVILMFVITIIISGGYNFSTKNSIWNIKKEDIYTLREEYDIRGKSREEIVKDVVNRATTKEDATILNNNYTKGVIATLVNEITLSGSVFVGIVKSVNSLLFNEKISLFVLAIISSVIFILYNIFLRNPLIVGKNRYFLEQRRYRKTEMLRVLYPVQVRRTRHIAYIMFFKDLYETLWYLTIVGGIIKHYEYVMIPYILAENPSITKEDAFRLSKELTNGKKLELFKLDLSLLGWKILQSLTINLSSVFFFDPYRETIYAEVYSEIREQNRSKLTKRNLLNDTLLFVKKEKMEEYPYIENQLLRWKRLDYNKDYSMESYILMFFTFSFIGYLWEVVFHLVSYGGLVNRGTMLGPWLPIYGYGGIAILILLKRFRDKPIILFITSMILCGLIEYFTGVYLEHFMHSRWWDYEGYFLNINGRVCLEGLLFFGLGGAGATYIAAPFLDRFYKKFNSEKLKVVIFLLVSLYAIDFIYSTLYPHVGVGITSSSINTILTRLKV